MKTKKTKLLHFLLFLSAIFVLSGCHSVSISTFPFDSGEPIPVYINDSEEIVVVSNSEFVTDLAKGDVVGYSYLHKFGRNDDIDTGSGFEALWNAGGDYTGFPPESETLEIRSDNVADTYGGTGAWTIKLSGLLNSSCHTQPTVYVNLSGTTWVTLDSNLYHRASRMSVTEAGSSEFNEGTLTLRHTTTTANIFARMPPEYGSTMIVATTVPANSHAFISDWYASLGNKVNGVSTVRLMMRNQNEAWTVREEFSIFADGSSYVNRQYKVPKNNIPGCTDVKVMADSSANNLAVAGGINMIFVEEGY